MDNSSLQKRHSVRKSCEWSGSITTSMGMIFGTILDLNEAQDGLFMSEDQSFPINSISNEIKIQKDEIVEIVFQNKAIKGRIAWIGVSPTYQCKGYGIDLNIQ